MSQATMQLEQAVERLKSVAGAPVTPAAAGEFTADALRLDAQRKSRASPRPCATRFSSNCAGAER